MIFSRPKDRVGAQAFIGAKDADGVDRGAEPGTSGAVRAFTDEMKRFYGLDYRPSTEGRVVFEVTDTTSIPNYDAIRFDGFALVVSKRTSGGKVKAGR